MTRFLVTYDSGYRATVTAVEIAAEVLTREGMAIDRRPVDRAEIAGHQGLIVGSPIRLGRCTPKIKKFLQKNRDSIEAWAQSLTGVMGKSP